MPPSVADIAPHRLASIETRASWVIAWTALAIYTVSFGAPVITVVALKPIAAELGDARSVPALACSLAWFGAAVGGIPMGWMAERFGIRRVVMFGAAMVAAGLAISTLGQSGRALCRARRVYRPLGQCLHQRAALCLCRALVRPAPRQRGGADLVRPVSRRHGLAGPLLARHRGAGLARHDARLRGLCRRHDRADRACRVPAAAGGRRRRSPPPVRCAAARCSACGRTW